MNPHIGPSWDQANAQGPSTKNAITEDSPYRSQEELERMFIDAAQTNDLQCVSNCLRWGVNPNCQPEGCHSALHIAAEEDNIGLAMKLLTSSNLNVNLVSKFGNTPLHVACQMGNKNMCSLLLRNGANTNNRDALEKTPLIIVCTHKHVKLVPILCTHGALVNLSDVFGNTPLSTALIPSPCIPLAEMLVAYGADINHYSTTTSLPLLLECARNCTTLRSLDAIDFLVDKGVDINTKDPASGKNALHMAALCGFVPLVRTLLRYECDVNQRDNTGMLPIDVAMTCESEEVVTVLRKSRVHFDTTPPTINVYEQESNWDVSL